MSTSERDADNLDMETVRELLHLVGESDINELKIERGGFKFHVRRGFPPPVPTYNPMVSTPQFGLPTPQMPQFAPPSLPGSTRVEIADPAIPPDGKLVTAPMVGTYYGSPSPKDPPFVTEGDEVKIGDPVGIIEAMKMMNTIESEFAGKVLRVLVKSGQPVEYGQPLLVIEA